MILFKEGQERLIYLPGFFHKNYFPFLHDALNWKQNSITVYGKTHQEPRLTAWYGEPYKYSSIVWPRQDWIEPLVEIRQRISEEIPSEFNSVLANYYRSGNDAMGWHRDNEREMDPRVIASASFGGERVFKFKHRLQPEKLEVVLESGSLLVMENFQNNWLHAVPRSKTRNEPRINLTFRRILEVK
jgi:alkylated DNA repair dioxygenase AlkB